MPYHLRITSCILLRDTFLCYFISTYKSIYLLFLALI